MAWAAVTAIELINIPNGWLFVLVIGFRHHAAGYVFFGGEPRSDLYVDLFGTSARVRSGIELGDG